MNEKIEKLENIVPQVIADIENCYQSRDSFCGVSSGFIELDQMTQGFRKSELTIIASRPGVGKTSFALNIFLHMLKNNTKTIYISAEQKETALIKRLISIDTLIPIEKIDSGLLKMADLEKIQNSAGELYHSKMMIFSMINMNFSKLKEIISSKVTEDNVEVIFIDYLTMIKPDLKYANRWEQVSEISRELKTTAMELNITIIALSPLNRNSLKTDPDLYHLSESGSIEYDSDRVIIIDTIKDYNEDFENSNVRVNLCKNRFGPIGTIDYKLSNRTRRFEII